MKGYNLKHYLHSSHSLEKSELMKLLWVLQIKAFLFTLVIISFCSATTFTVTSYRVQNSGFDGYPNISVTIVFDCDKGLVTTQATGNGTWLAYQDSYLFYMDYGDAPILMSSGKGDKNGKVIHKVSGNPSIMTGMFRLRTDKSGFRSNEVEFYIEECRGGISPAPFQPPSPPPPPPSKPAPVAGDNCTNNSECIDSEYCNKTQNTGPGTGKCLPVANQTCGYATNHAWYSYECCKDFDCGYLHLYCNLTDNMCRNKSTSEMDKLLNGTNETRDLSEKNGNASQDGKFCQGSSAMVFLLGAVIFYNDHKGDNYE